MNIEQLQTALELKKTIEEYEKTLEIIDQEIEYYTLKNGSGCELYIRGSALSPKCVSLPQKMYFDVVTQAKNYYKNSISDMNKAFLSL